MSGFTGFNGRTTATSGAAVTVAAMVTVVAAATVLASCSSPLTDASSSSVPGERPRTRATTDPARPVATIAPRPTHPLPPQQLELSWRELYGASVPVADGPAGPRRLSERGADGFARWERSAAGAALAGSYYAVVVDARMPPRLWNHALDQARPLPAAARLASRLARARPAKDVGRRNGEPMDSGPPPQVWHPPVSPVATSAVRLGRRSAALTVWSRTEDGATWRSRRVRLQWTDGDWRLRLPIGNWRVSTPPPGLRPLTAGVEVRRESQR